MSLKWYSARCIFAHRDLTPKPTRVYEERVVLLRARSFDEAIRKGEIEAKKYACDLIACKYTGLIQVFESFASKMKDLSEVYSLMRESELRTKHYLDSFFDTGRERQQNYKSKKRANNSLQRTRFARR